MGTGTVDPSRPILLALSSSCQTAWSAQWLCAEACRLIHSQGGYPVAAVQRTHASYLTECRVTVVAVIEAVMPSDSDQPRAVKFQQ